MGKIFKVTAAGAGSLLYDAAELDVTALAIGRDGALVRRYLACRKGLSNWK
jgi:hypothetical protein